MLQHFTILAFFCASPHRKLKGATMFSIQTKWTLAKSFLTGFPSSYRSPQGRDLSTSQGLNWYNSIFLVQNIYEAALNWATLSSFVRSGWPMLWATLESETLKLRVSWAVTLSYGPFKALSGLRPCNSDCNFLWQSIYFYPYCFLWKNIAYGVLTYSTAWWFFQKVTE